MIEGCTCDEGFGLPHDHQGKVVMIQRDGGRWSEWQSTGEIRLWVDWRRVARAALTDGDQSRRARRAECRS